MLPSHWDREVYSRRRCPSTPPVRDPEEPVRVAAAEGVEDCEGEALAVADTEREGEAVADTEREGDSEVDVEVDGDSEADAEAIAQAG